MPHDLAAHISPSEFEKAVNEGKTLKAAKLAAGYSAMSARLGAQQLPPVLKDIWYRKWKAGVKAGQRLKLDDAKHFIASSLVKNVTEGTDKGSRSIELLGKMTGIDVFRLDQTQVAVQINMPQQFTHHTETLTLPE